LIAYDGAMTSTSDRSPNGPSVVPPALHSWLIETLEKQGAGDKTPRLEPLQTEASFRQFYRVIGANQPLVLMDSPPAKEQNPQFVAIAASFAAQGIRVPTVLAHQADDGWLLLTDLGHTHFMDAYREGNEQQCLQAALTTLGRIAAVDDPVIADYTAGCRLVGARRLSNRATRYAFRGRTQTAACKRRGSTAGVRASRLPLQEFAVGQGPVRKKQAG